MMTETKVLLDGRFKNAKKKLSLSIRWLGRIFYAFDRIVFNRMWLLITFVVSMYFSLWVYPKMYNNLTGTVTQLFFLTTDDNNNPVYWLNTYENKIKYNKNIIDNKNLYYDGCTMLPLSQRNMCDATNNWSSINVKQFGCESVSGCYEVNVKIPQGVREAITSAINTDKGLRTSVQDREKISLSDPAGWGLDAKWPLFFFFMYFGLKLGQLVSVYIYPATENK